MPSLTCREQCYLQGIPVKRRHTIWGSLHLFQAGFDCHDWVMHMHTQFLSVRIFAVNVQCVGCRNHYIHFSIHLLVTA